MTPITHEEIKDAISHCQPFAQVFFSVQWMDGPIVPLDCTLEDPFEWYSPEQRLVPVASWKDRAPMTMHDFEAGDYATEAIYLPDEGMAYTGQDEAIIIDVTAGPSGLLCEVLLWVPQSMPPLNLTDSTQASRFFTISTQD